MSSSDSDCDDFVPYKCRADWNDVVPVAQDDGPVALVAIAYSDQFQDVYDYFRGILRTGEKSARVLDLTHNAISLNPANYTVWHYRRLVLREIDADLKAELQYITKTIKAHPKNYQVWYHRQLIVKWLDDPSEELDFTAYVLSKDAKNYHAWQHRQWLIRTYALWDGELEYVDKLISDDLRNNSAWSQRYFVVSNTTDFTPEVIQQETSYTLNIISKARNNESPWNYLRGMISLTSFAEQKPIRDFCNDLYSKDCRSPHLLSMLVDISEQSINADDSDVADDRHLDRALELCAELAMEYDSIRAAYWTFIGSKLEKKYRTATASSG